MLSLISFYILTWFHLFFFVVSGFLSILTSSLYFSSLLWLTHSLPCLVVISLFYWHLTHLFFFQHFKNCLIYFIITNFNLLYTPAFLRKRLSTRLQLTKATVSFKRKSALEIYSDFIHCNIYELTATFFFPHFVFMILSFCFPGES